MAVQLGYGVWLANRWTDRTEDFRAVAATVRRHALNGDLRVFTRPSSCRGLLLRRELPG